jgi:hypothetical protein
MSEKKPIVMWAASTPANCPVCGKPSYSATGTHPQCAVAHADSLTHAKRKETGAAARKAKSKPWSKACPKCKRQIAARRIVCDCGHRFGALPVGTAGK